jgi:hypothetical protein
MDGIVFCSPSIHKDGAPYEIIGTAEPAVLNFTQARVNSTHKPHLYQVWSSILENATS